MANYKTGQRRTQREATRRDKTNTGNIIVFVVVPLALAALLTAWAIKGYQRLLLLRRDGVQTLATVTNKAYAHSRGHNYYLFTVRMDESKLVTSGTVQATAHEFGVTRVGQSVGVTYLPGDPEQLQLGPVTSIELEDYIEQHAINAIMLVIAWYVIVFIITGKPVQVSRPVSRQRSPGSR